MIDEIDYKHYFNNNTTMNCILSTSLVILDINTMFLNLLGYDKEEIINKNFIDIIYPDDIILIKNLNYSIRVFTKNKNILFLTWNNTICNNFIYSNIVNNIDNLLTTKVSYELIEPLNVIMGYAQLLLSDNSLNVITNKYITNIYDNSIIMLNLINNILKILHTDTENDIENVLIYDVLLFCINENKHNIEYNNLNLIFYVENSNYCISINKLKFKEIINNIIKNAIIFNKTYGEIVIKCHVENNNITISIKDTGIGISKENISKLYTPFCKFNNKNEGSGLGLCIIKKFLNIYDGIINCNSVVNEYTEFMLTFKTSLMVDINDNKNIIINNNKLKILYIEDTHQNAMLISELIYKKYKIKIDIAYNGTDGINLIKKYNYNIILIDYILPDITCDIIIEKLLNDKNILNTNNIIITTAYDEKFMTTVYNKFNIQYYLPKPIKVKDLYTICDNIIFNSKI